MANWQAVEDNEEAGSQLLFDDYIQPGQQIPSHSYGLNSDASNSQAEADATSTVMVTMSPPRADSSCGRVQLTIYTYPELHRFILEIVKIFEEVYNIRRHHGHDQ